jgi:hypothetical protein
MTTPGEERAGQEHAEIPGKDAEFPEIPNHYFIREIRVIRG